MPLDGSSLHEPFNREGLNQQIAIDAKLENVRQMEVNFPEFKGLTALLAKDKSMAADPKNALTNPNSSAYKMMLGNLTTAGKNTHSGLAKTVDLGNPKELQTLMRQLAEAYITQGKDPKYNLVAGNGSLTTMTNVAHYLKDKLIGKMATATPRGIKFEGPTVRL